MRNVHSKNPSPAESCRYKTACNRSNLLSQLCGGGVHTAQRRHYTYIMQVEMHQHCWHNSSASVVGQQTKESQLASQQLATGVFLPWPRTSSMVKYLHLSIHSAVSIRDHQTGQSSSFEDHQRGGRRSPESPSIVGRPVFKVSLKSWQIFYLSGQGAM